MALDDVDRAILDFESEITWWKHTGSKEHEIRQRFDLGPVPYYQRLVQLLAEPAASAYAPATVRRLRAQQAARSDHRRRGRTGSPNP